MFENYSFLLARHFFQRPALKQTAERINRFQPAAIFEGTGFNPWPLTDELRQFTEICVRRVSSADNCQLLNLSHNSLPAIIF
jgi:hypothetical protein